MFELASLAVYGPIFLGVMILLTIVLKWPTWVNYIWGGIALLWGVMGYFLL